ncbi:hypothetical protein WJX79_004651 [Trebouxia sp. C0005]
MATHGGIEASESRLLPDTDSQLISFNIVALQSMMQAVAREVAERICVEGPTGVKLRECADKVIGLKQEMTVLKQNVKSQANTQDSLRAAVSVLDKQKQLASAIPTPVGPTPNPAETQQVAEPKAQAAGPTVAPEPVVQPVTVVQFDSTALEGSISDVKRPSTASTPVADTASVSAPLGTAATAAASPSSVPAGSKAAEQSSGEDKENDAAAVTAVIWKELAEMSAAQAKLKAAVGAGVEDVREVRQRLVAIEAGIVKSQRQEDKRGVDLLHRLSESEAKVSGFASELEASNQKTETRCNGIRKEVSKAMSEQRQQLIAQSEAMAKKMDSIAAKADRATQELPSLVAPISRGLNAAVERLSLLEHTALKPGDAIQPNDLDKILARAMEGPRAGISNVEQHVSQLEQRLEDCLVHKANSADVPSNTQMANQVAKAQSTAQAGLQALQDQMQQHLAGKADKEGVQAGEAGLQQRCSQLEMALLQGLQQVTDRAAAALSLKADGEEVSELRLYVKGEFADVRAAAKEGMGRGRLTHTSAAGQTLCLSCDQPLSPLRPHTHQPLTQQGVYPVPDEGVTEGWSPSAAPLSTNEPIGAAINARHQAEKKRLQIIMAPADHVPPARTSTPELAELSTNPSVVRASNPRLKQQTVSGSIAQGYLPSKQNNKGSGVSSGAARRPADLDPARRSSK